VNNDFFEPKLNSKFAINNQLWFLLPVDQQGIHARGPILPSLKNAAKDIH
jgi:hypothetical protein